MITVTLNIKNQKDYKLLLQLAKRLGVDVSISNIETKQHKPMRNIYDLVDNIKDEKLFSDIEDPLEWQRKLRNEWK